jgi:hypothetical protein
LISSITGHFGVLPTEIGFSSQGGLGSSGHQLGEAESASRLGAEPLMKWIEQQICDMSYKFLGMPRELVFQFQAGNESDTGEEASRRDTEIKSGQRTINEAKAELGLPLIDSEYADMPMVIAGATTFFISPDGLIPVGSAPPTPEGAPTEQPVAEGEIKPEADTKETPTEPTQDEQAEVKAFLKWAKKSQDREFEFEALDFINASALNRAYRNGETDLVKALADGVLKKA